MSNLQAIHAVYETRRGCIHLHTVQCNIPRDCSEPVALELVGRMKSNEALKKLKPGHDFRWLGATRIGFRRRRDAALFITFFDHKIEEGNRL